MQVIPKIAKNLINNLDELQKKGISVIKEGEYTKLYYNLLEGADFNDYETCLCRGITFKGDKIVSFPFVKFGNYGEEYADDIDWDSARVLEKLDGSLMTLWFDDNFWHVSTSKKINAFSAEVSVTNTTFGDLFIQAAIDQNICLNRLNPKYTYIFELTSPYNKVVVPYSETSIWHIGTRDNETLEEVEVDIGIKKPKSYPIKNLSECIEVAAALEGIKEGFVVVDKYYNRIKVKSPLYISLHHTHNNGQISRKDILTLILTHEEGEYLTYFPEKEAIIFHYKYKIDNLINLMEEEYAKYKEYLKTLSRKDAVLFMKDMFTIPDFGITNLYKYEINATEYLKNMSTNAVLRMIGEKE
jgi:T4 RnlA family RNA ligase